MNDEEVTRLLNRRADEVPDTHAPVNEVIAAGRAGQRQNRRRYIAAGVALAACVVGGVVVQRATTGGAGAPGERPVVAAPEPRVIARGDALQRWSDWTAADWVRTSDYVVVARAVSEQAHPNGPDSGSVERSVELDIKQVVWSRPSPSRPLPPTVTVTAFGWTDDNIPLASSGTPRIEPGHDYVVALVWMPAQCSPGDPAEPAQWTPLGSNAVLPFDNARIGYGESEGRLVAGDGDQAPAGTLELRLLGQSLTELRDALLNAPPPSAQDPRTLPQPSTC
ncbi:MAG: hypothetical protein JWR64_2309 [Marmoricola sp.]|nr:hypothetical protein [Marmoricola sp.]